MTTKENYVLQVFNYLLSRYPAICNREMTVPSCETFQLESVPPQYDPQKVQDENPSFYDAVSAYIIDSHLRLYDKRRRQRAENNLKEMFKALKPEQARAVVNKYLALAGRDHERGAWNFMDDDKGFRRKLPHRVKNIHEDLIPIIRKSLTDFAWRGKPIPTDVIFWMKVLTAPK